MSKLLSDHICGLNEAYYLYQAGVPQESLFYHTQEKTPTNPNLQYYGYDQRSIPWNVHYGKRSKLSGSTIMYEYSAFTLSELLNLLGGWMVIEKGKSKFWTLNYSGTKGELILPAWEDTNPVDMCARALVYLIQNKYIYFPRP